MADFKILAFQNPEFKILAQIKILANFAKCKNDYHTRFRLGKIPISAVLAVPIGNQKIVWFATESGPAGSVTNY